MVDVDDKSRALDDSNFEPAAEPTTSTKNSKDDCDRSIGKYCVFVLETRERKYFVD